MCLRSLSYFRQTFFSYKWGCPPMGSWSPPQGLLAPSLPMGVWCPPTRQQWPPSRKCVNGHFGHTVGCGCLSLSEFGDEWEIFFSHNWLKTSFQTPCLLIFSSTFGLGWLGQTQMLMNPLSLTFPYYSWVQSLSFKTISYKINSQIKLGLIFRNL